MLNYPEHTIIISKTKFKFPCQLKSYTEKEVNGFTYFLRPSKDNLLINLKPLSLLEGNEQMFVEGLVHTSENGKVSCIVQTKKFIKTFHLFFIVALIIMAVLSLMKGNIGPAVFTAFLLFVVFMQMTQIRKGALILKENLEVNLPHILELV